MVAKGKEIQSSYHLTEVKEDSPGKGEVDYVNIIQLGFLLPHFTLSDGFEKKFDLKEQIGKHHIILSFLHRADCYCTRPFLKMLQQHWGEIKNRNGLLVAVSVDHPKILTRLATELQLEFSVLYDLRQIVVRLYTVFDRDSVSQEPHPALFLADLQGVIRDKQISLEHADKLSLQTLLEQLRVI